MTLPKGIDAAAAEGRTHEGEVAACIKCGCDDLHACKGGCHWIRVNYERHAGVCSKCPGAVATFDAGRYQHGKQVSKAGALVDVSASSPDLLPCPFCGNDAMEITDYSVGADCKHMVMCGDCGTSGPWGDIEEEARDRWNQRAEL